VANKSKTIIGIVGGICSGKSTVSAELSKLGCAIIKADDIAHGFLNYPDVKQNIIEIFGDLILDNTGCIDRKKLASAAFDDRKKLELLNEIIHPLVMAEVEQQIALFNEDDAAKAIVLDIPLLLEVGWDKKCDTIIFVRCDEAKRVENAEISGFLTAKELKKRENFQISLDSKAAVAENTIDNIADLSALAKQVAILFPKIVKTR